MKIQIENLRVQMRGVQLNNYQRTLALDEYYKLLDYVEELEQLTIPSVIGQSEQLFCYTCQTWTEHKDQTKKSYRCTMCGNMKAK